MTLPAEICELAGPFTLNNLEKGLPRKELHKVFEQFGLKITAETNLHVVNFLDVTFDLTTESTGKYKPYRKPMTIRYTYTNTLTIHLAF